MLSIISKVPPQIYAIHGQFDEWWWLMWSHEQFPVVSKCQCIKVAISLIGVKLEDSFYFYFIRTLFGTLWNLCFMPAFVLGVKWEVHFFFFHSNIFWNFMEFMLNSCICFVVRHRDLWTLISLHFVVIVLSVKGMGYREDV